MIITWKRLLVNIFLTCRLSCSLQVCERLYRSLITMFAIALLVPIIHEDEPRRKNTTRRATWDGSRDSSTVAQLLSGSKGLHGYGSSG